MRMRYGGGRVKESCIQGLWAAQLCECVHVGEGVKETTKKTERRMDWRAGRRK